jgi:PAS domain S-box-containing protein
MSESRRSESTNELPGDNLVPLESVLCTEELNQRPTRPPDYETENRALVSLAKVLSESPGTILQTLADKILEVFKADSAGVSLLTQDGKRFYWPAIAGLWKPHLGGGTPRDFGPCGDVLDYNAPLMFRHFELRYTYFVPVTPAVEECILVPFYVDSKAVGTIWAIAHDDRRKFDAEDMRQLISLGSFASTAYQAVTLLDASKQQDETLKQTHAELDQNIVELRRTTIQAQDSRRAALNLMEDAVQSREAMQILNAELLKSEERFRSLVTVITDVPWTKDAEGAFSTPQPAWEAYTGQSWEEYRGFGWANALHPDDREQVLALWSAVVESRMLYESDGRIWHEPSQEWHHFTAKAIPLLNADGSVREWVGAYTDIDDVKRAAEERERLLTSEHEARGEAETANRVKDEFLAVVSHELRTPLNAILGWAHMLMRGSLDEKTSARGLETIARNATAQNQLISDLLDVSRIISGQLRCEMAGVDLIPLINAAVDTVRPAADGKGIELRVMLEPAAGMVSGDAARLQQIVSNLLTNAVKFTARDGRVTVHLEREGTDVAIIVRDTGEGISPEFLPYIFDRFRQAEGTSSRQHGGLGLGLAIVRHLVGLHGGTVSAASEGVGKGATLRATFPCIAVSRNGTDLESARCATDSFDDGESLLLTGINVLVVDDEPDARELLTIALTHSHAEVRAVSTSQEALEMLNQWRPDVLISDIGMPGEDGYELIRKVRALEPERGGMIPAVALTGYASIEDTARASLAGFQLHLPKPVSPKNLVAAVASLTLKARRV